MEIPADHVRLAKVVGENDEGMTLFLPKDMTGTFHIDDGDKFFTVMFIKHEGDELESWVPWEGK